MTACRVLMALAALQPARAAASTAFCASPLGFTQKLGHTKSFGCRRTNLRNLHEVKMASPAKYEGIYDFTHAGGTFDVHLRPGGRFFAPQFQAKSTWDVTQDDDNNMQLKIEWAKFGTYALTLTSNESPSFEGSAVGDAKNWRKMAKRTPFSAAEANLFDSLWDFQHPGGSFPVEFRADAFNHFVSKDFPAHSHWSLSGTKLYINWGAYGEYELDLDESGEAMSGHLKGQPSNWRKATRKGALADKVVATEVFTEFH